MTYRPTIFPELSNALWAKVDLNAHAQQDFPDISRKNPLLDGAFCDEWVNRIARNEKANFTWGGYLEDRQHLWRGYYGGAKFVTHLGIDYNVPAGTLVSAPENCVVVHRLTDHEMENGWGGRLILELSKPWQGSPFLILGHLAHQDLPGPGESFTKGASLARTGVINENGGWFPHIHVQCCTADFFMSHESDLSLLDGYYLESKQPQNVTSDPTMLVGVQCDGHGLKQALVDKKDVVNSQRQPS